MGEVVAFRRKKLSGFIPEETVEEYRESLRAMTPREAFFAPSPGPGIFDPYAPLDFGDSGDCA